MATICITTPAPPRSRKGNRQTAARWASLLRELDHRVTVQQEWDGKPVDVLVGLHALKSARSIHRFSKAFPEKPLIVGLAGTDLYRDIRTSRKAQRSLELATRLLALQPGAFDVLPPHLHSKVRIVVQSATAPASKPKPSKRTFDICVLAHLRAVKDPFRAAMASRSLPRTSKIRILQLGEALSESMETRALREQERNPRYRWLGKTSHSRSQKILQRSHLTVLSSRLEGGANVISEALAIGTPVLASRVSGNIGLLGQDYLGYFPVGDTEALTELMHRAETNADFLAMLEKQVRVLTPSVSPHREKMAWSTLLHEVISEPTSLSQS